MPRGILIASYAWSIGILSMVAYELFAVFNGIPNDTLSEAVWYQVPHRLVIPLAVGVLCGHLFGQRHFHTWVPLTLFVVGVVLGVVSWQASQ